MQGHFVSVFWFEVVHVIARGFIKSQLGSVDARHEDIRRDSGPVAFGIGKSLALKSCFRAVIRSQYSLVPQIVHRIRTEAENICELGAGSMFGNGSGHLTCATESHVVDS